MSQPIAKRAPQSLSAGEPERARPWLARVGQDDWIVEVPASAESLRGDASGRWQAARLAGQLYRRLLDGRTVCYESQRSPPVEVEAAPTYAAVASLATVLAEAIAAPATEVQLADNTTREALVARLRRCAAHADEGPEADMARYQLAYPEPVEILPPDRYRDLVLLPASGCPSARCTFCAFYRGRAFRPFDPEQLRAHARAVTDLLGPALRLRTGLFLGSASALSLSQRRVVQAMELARRSFPLFERGTASFWDPDHSPQRGAAQWEALAELSLRAIYVGLETGLPALRERVGKSGAIEQLVRAVKAPREALTPNMLRIGVIVMVGLGGPAWIEPHHRATAEVVGRLELAPSDVVYLSPLAHALTSPSLQAETARLRNALRDVTAARVVPYAMERFRYFA